MTLVLVVLFLLLSFALLLVGLRGRRIDDHPICRQCKYDLVGSPQTPQLCPECGTDLTKTRAVRVGRRRRRSALIACGALFSFLGASGGVWMGWHKYNEVDWTTVKPVWLLKQESTSSDPAVAGTAVFELRVRLYDYWFSQQRLSESQVTDLVEHALGIQADPNVVWSPQWGEFVEVAWHMGLVTDEQVFRYVRNAFQPGIQITARKVVRAGALLPIRIDYAPCRTYPESLFYAKFFQERVTLADSDLPKSLLIQEPWEMASLNSRSEWKRLFVSAAPGDHTLTVVYRTVTRSDLHDEIVAEWTTVLKTNVTVAPFGKKTIELVRDGRLKGTVRSAIAAEPIRLSDDQSFFDVSAFITVRPPPVDLAFKVLLRRGKEELRVANLTVEKDGGPIWQNVDSSAVQAFLANVPTVDVVFRPSAIVAERSLGVTKMWFEEVVIRDVEVQWQKSGGSD